MWLKDNRMIYFTKNGSVVNELNCNVLFCDLSPTIEFQSNVSMKYNFGQENFSFDLSTVSTLPNSEKKDSSGFLLENFTLSQNEINQDKNNLWFKLNDNERHKKTNKLFSLLYPRIQHFSQNTRVKKNELFENFLDTESAVNYISSHYKNHKKIFTKKILSCDAIVGARVKWIEKQFEGTIIHSNFELKRACVEFYFKEKSKKFEIFFF